MVTYEYGDLEHPERITRAIHGPPYTSEDHALLAGLQAYEQTLCPGGCGFPIVEAWHSDMDGWYDEVHRYVCHACTAKHGSERSFPVVASSRDLTASPLPPFDLNGTTSRPTDKPAVPKPSIDMTMEGGGQ